MAHPSTRLVQTSAPGKFVLSGEYAVLLGAPALVAAVDRYAKCSLEIRRIDNWSIRSQPPFWNADFTLESLKETTPRDRVAYALQCLSRVVELPEHARLAMDTRSLFQFGKKIGMGSSAATLVSLYVAICVLGNLEHTIEGALDLHSQVRGSGSGLDVAASYHGGVIEFRERHARPIQLPHGLELKVFYAGASTSTSDRVVAFRSWIASQPASTVDRFCTASEGVVESTGSAGEFLDALRYFVEVQELIDNGSGLGIWGPQHRAMKSLANREGVLYKPSGAGGGDIGLAVSVNKEILERLEVDAERIGLRALDTSLVEQGVTVEMAS
ncbi:MAG: hypothetical protein OXG08_12665 [Gammaproteobacteria bacterium]|nr:hypothetical protein [Gammaproteobacteria bacterium]